ncbi:MerR family transcriptional regulator (plasmid) [Thermus thermophilus]|uniref:helix-turn-helix domain-containing protein n=1 Tax=Thermus thermophilus TaxID=274 RepID=UPI0001660004|nr:helix-turn-helix domain-containing protein [Thermus thermophilus]BCP99229.1 MerR family transcriptional regulator [Thermus thermophilus]BCQ01554.1 MerR family transcriptional regulator [Thermus thermophilus]
MEHPEGEDPTLLPPALAARALGVSPATLRRYAALWERVVGPLPRDPRGGRLWPKEALARLRAAREAHLREGLPLEEALARVQGDFPALALPSEGEALALLRALAERLERVEGELKALREENARLREALKALEPPRRRPWWRFWGH